MMQETESEANAVVELREVSCFRDGALLRQISLRFSPASFNVLLGDAGSGLLLRLASLLEQPESGDVHLLRQSTGVLDEASRCSLRSRHFGFVFSSPCLLPGLSVAENVAMPLFKIHGLNPGEAGDRLAQALEFVGLHSIERDDVDHLARFDQQRVALARAIAHRPELLVLDRADLALNGEETSKLLEIVRRSREELGTTVLTTFASHTTADRTDRILAIEDGVIRRDTAVASSAETQGSSAS
jgi:putative ABC transport system ATP-binding protein